ncbi:exosortase F system-associated membrane protein [Marinigracilibium pacificum]|uniref:Exosortase F system-associated protein n=1 Tax=Marinigracilibium pacificum TaxID=2729599 RepID=A0A848IXJ2_9BACT|nr:exosortase F system-associated protein [Marinigracilibium pacificum]NMM48031.1 exosortase F system-associated protein [Marinigracilibium pacificum]
MNKDRNNLSNSLRVFWLIFGLVGLAVVYITQKWGWVDLITQSLGVDTGEWEKITFFLWNRALRFVLNDIFAIAVIAGLFGKKDFVLIAILIQIGGFVLFFIPYVILKLYFPNYNGPLINFIHRLILNPVLMALLIPAFYMKQKQENDQK